MTLEDLIYKRISECESVTSILGEYRGAAAVFFSQAPGDNDAGWNKRREYPRLTYFVNRAADAERRTQGAMSLNIWCDGTSAQPEDLEPVLRELFDGVFFTPERDMTYCVAWATSEMFEVLPEQRTSREQTQVTGIAMMFDLFEFPRQVTTNPDPVLTMGDFTRRFICENAVIIGCDDIGKIYKPTADAPAFYWRLGTISADKVFWAVSWVAGEIAGHVFAPSAEERLKWIKVAATEVSVQAEAVMPDNSPMFFTTFKADSGADFLRSGQMRIGVRYGILRDENRGTALNNISVEQVIE